MIYSAAEIEIRDRKAKQTQENAGYGVAERAQLPSPVLHAGPKTRTGWEQRNKKTGENQTKEEVEEDNSPYSSGFQTPSTPPAQLPSPPSAAAHSQMFARVRLPAFTLHCRVEISRARAEMFTVKGKKNGFGLITRKFWLYLHYLVLLIRLYNGIRPELSNKNLLNQFFLLNPEYQKML